MHEIELLERNEGRELRRHLVAEPLARTPLHEESGQALRAERPEAFATGSYTPLPLAGTRAPHAVAFSRGDQAVVVVREGVDRDDALASAIQQQVKSVIAPYKYPRIVEFVDALPRTALSASRSRDG